MSEVIYPELDWLTIIQSRAEINEQLIDEYATLMAEGDTAFDPVDAVRDGQGQIYVWDGYHRLHAARRAHYRLAVRVKPGTQTEAEWLAIGANQKHGLRRSNQDKQRSVRLALLHPNGSRLSNREISRHCGVDHATVGKIRRELELSGEIHQIETRLVKRDGQRYQLHTANIGHQPKPQPGQFEEQVSSDSDHKTHLQPQPIEEPASSDAKPPSQFIPEQIKQVEQEPQPEVSSAEAEIIPASTYETRYCPDCGSAHQLDLAFLKPGTSVPISCLCPACGQIVRTGDFLVEQPFIERFRATTPHLNGQDKPPSLSVEEVKREEIEQFILNLLPQLTLAQLKEVKRVLQILWDY